MASLESFALGCIRYLCTKKATSRVLYVHELSEIPACLLMSRGMACTGVGGRRERKKFVSVRLDACEIDASLCQEGKPLNVSLSPSTSHLVYIGVKSVLRHVKYIRDWDWCASEIKVHKPQ